MTLTATPNIALDRTYVVGRVEVGALHKVREAFAHTGGKGVNVSRTLALLGHPTFVTGLLGGAGIEEATRELRAAGLDCDLYAVAGPPRHTVTVTAEDGTTTAFDEPGPTVTDLEWQGFVAHVRRLLGAARIFVMAGSLPPGAPEDAWMPLVTAARERGVASIVDCRGAALRAALGAHPQVAKLNRAELSETLERSCASDDDIVEGARLLQELGAQNVIVTLGADGAIGLDGDDVWRITHPAQSGNPIGAGDAFTAGVAVKLAESQPFPAALRAGAAAALASLRSPTAGQIAPADVSTAEPQVEIHLLGKAEARQ